MRFFYGKEKNMNLLNMLLGSMTSGTSVDALANKTGLSAVSLIKLLSKALPLLLRSLTQNASSAGGAQALLGALAQHKETRSMADQIREADEEDGEKIVKHIFGDQSDDMIEKLAADAELGTGETKKALANVAPALMSGLSAATTSASKVDLSDGLDLGDLMAMFSGGESAKPSAKPASDGGLLGGLSGLLGGNSAGGGIGGLLGGNSAGGGIGSLLGGLFGGSDKKESDDDDKDLDGMALLGSLTSLLK